MVSSLKELVKENRNKRSACGAEEVREYLISCSAIRGQVSDLVDSNETLEKEARKIHAEIKAEERPKYDESMVKDGNMTVYLKDLTEADRRRLEKTA